MRARAGPCGYVDNSKKMQFSKNRFLIKNTCSNKISKKPNKKIETGLKPVSMLTFHVRFWL